MTTRARILVLMAVLGCWAFARSPRNLPNETLSIAHVGNSVVLDSLRVTDPESAVISHALHETLYEYAYLDPGFRAVPSIAADMPELSKDRLTAQIRLRTDVRFRGLHHALTAQDVVYTLKRLADPATHAAGWWMFEWKIAGLDDFRNMLSRAKPTEHDQVFAHPVAGLSAPDPQTLVIRLTRPYPQLVDALASVNSAPIAREVEELQKPGGETGPYFVVSRDENEGILLERNPEYHGDFYPVRGSLDSPERNLLADKGATLPLIRRIKLRFEPNQDSVWKDFMEERLDIAGGLAIPPDSVLKKSKERSDRFVTEKGAVSYSILVNVQDEKLRDRKIRQALSSALDRGRWIGEFNPEGGEKLVSLTPPIVSGAPTGTKLRFDFDLGRAEKLLKEAGHPQGRGLPAFKLSIGGEDQVSTRLGEFLKTGFARVGIQVEPAYYPFAEYLKKLNSGDFQLAVWGWALDYPDARSILRVFYGGNQRPNGPNLSAFRDSRYDQMYEKMVRLPDGAERSKLIAAMESIVQEEVPVLMGYRHAIPSLVQARVRNYVPRSLITNRLKYLGLKD